MGRMGEPSAMVKMLLQRFDKDGDQKLDEQELVTAFTAMRAQAGGESGPGLGMGMPGFGGPGMGGPGQGGPQMAARMFDRLDVDGDGKLTGNEIPERMRQGMTRLDANGDGSIERKELEEMMSRMGGQGRRPGGDRPGRDQAPEGNRTPRRPPTE
jgi:Ca2+-binding EF-hand superfamily protein